MSSNMQTQTILNYEQPRRRMPVVGIVALVLSFVACAATGLCWITTPKVELWVIAASCTMTGLICGLVGRRINPSAWCGLAVGLSLIALISTMSQFLYFVAIIRALAGGTC